MPTERMHTLNTNMRTLRPFDRSLPTPATPPSAPSLSINGRFYSQATTGVQRYGREITLAMDALLARAGQRGSIILPGNARDVPHLAAFDTIRTHGATGHVWEQTVLPFRAQRPTLNLCNTGPIPASGQVVCVHDVNVFTAPESYSRSFRTLYRFILPQIVKRSFRVTSVSEYSRNQIVECFHSPNVDITVIPNGHEHVFRWDATKSSLRDGYGDARPFVLLLGSRARHKNIDFILAQAEALDAMGLDLVVVGGSASIFSKTGAIACPNIHQLGVVSDNDLAFLYRHALCLAFPSRSEGFGVPIVEAMALGCPVVSSDRASLPEVCGTAALMADPDDAQGWQRHFRNLTGSAQLRTELQQRGRDQVLKFSWARSARMYLDLLAKIS